MRSCAPGHACTLHLKRTPTCAGPTGCGKSSLVNALAGRLPAGGSLEGEVLVNGLPRGRGFQGITAYVMQVGGVSASCLCGWCAAVMQAVCRPRSSAWHSKSIGKRPDACLLQVAPGLLCSPISSPAQRRCCAGRCAVPQPDRL